MRASRVMGLILIMALACAAIIWAISSLNDLWSASADYGEHHEATVALCRMIALSILSLGLGLTGARIPSSHSFGQVLAPLAALALPVLIALGTELIFANEIFFSLFDPKGFPVHPTEPVVFPEAGWQSMPSVLLSSLIMFLVFGWMWWRLRLKSASSRRSLGAPPEPIN
jgi:hypothetical protein